MDEMPICNMANLVAVIFGEKKSYVYEKLGLPVEKCPICGLIIRLGNEFPQDKGMYPYCSQKCKNQSVIDVVCDNCGQLFKRREKAVIFRLGKLRYEHTFCSKKCVMGYIGKNYGWGKQKKGEI